MCILTVMSCMSTFRFIFQNRTFLCRKKLFSTLLLVQLTDLFPYNSYSSLLFLELGGMRKGVLYPMDPFAQPIRFQSHCWSSAEGQKTFLFRHRFRHQDFYDMLRVFSPLDITSRSVSSYAVWQERSLLILSQRSLLHDFFLRRLAYPCRYGDLVNKYNLPSNRLCDIFHSTLGVSVYQICLSLATTCPLLWMFSAVCRCSQQFWLAFPQHHRYNRW